MTFRKLSDRSAVWSEPELVEQGEWEFVDTEKFIKTGEDLVSFLKYRLLDIFNKNSSVILERLHLLFLTCVFLIANILRMGSL